MQCFRVLVLACSASLTSAAEPLSHQRFCTPLYVSIEDESSTSNLLYYRVQVWDE